VKISVFNTTELVNLYLYLCERGYHHDCVDVNASATGTADVVEDPVAFYLEDYDLDSTYVVVGVSDSDSPHFV
jgi:hypothetical protein